MSQVEHRKWGAFVRLIGKTEKLKIPLFNENFFVGFWSQWLDKCDCAISKRIHCGDVEIIIFDD